MLLGRLNYRYFAFCGVALLLLTTFHHLRDQAELRPWHWEDSEPSGLADDLRLTVSSPQIQAPTTFSPEPAITSSGSQLPPPETPITPPTLTRPKIDWNARAELVKEAFLHAYRNYEKHALPHDELKPLSMKPIDNFNGWGVTMYDSLDTMLLMGLHEEFGRAMPHIQAANFSHTTPSIPFFETTIRYLGGLLSAYALSNEPLLLDRADDLGTKLSPVFDTRSGLPAFSVTFNPHHNNASPAIVGVLAEIATCQLEYTYLARVTGKTVHYDRAAKIMQVLGHANISGLGMLPTQFNLNSGEPTSDSLSVGAAADSAHEYLLKLYLLSAQTDEGSLDLYVSTANRILTSLLYVSPKRGLLYVTDTQRSAVRPRPSRKFEHLSCFLPGLLALGAYALPDSAFDRPTTYELRPTMLDEAELKRHNWRELHMLAAEGLAESCYQMYADQPTGIAPNEVVFHGTGETTGDDLWIRRVREWRLSGKWGLAPGIGARKALKPEDNDYRVKDRRYLLRPETIESIYIMWKTTGNDRWRERGWAIFQALEQETKIQSGYASLVDVGVSPAKHADDMPSYFLAETLKYLFLLFREDDPVPLDRWVFNTEAHPLPIFEWTAWERIKYGIP